MNPNNKCPVCGTSINIDSINTKKGFESGGGTLYVLHTCPNCNTEIKAWFDLQDKGKFLGLEID